MTSSLSESEISAARFWIVFDFESNFRSEDSANWMSRNWTYSIVIVCLYVPILFWGQHLMKLRPKYRLQGLLLVWNVSLALFSLVAALRLWVELYYVLKEFGFHYSICQSCISNGCSSVAHFWLFFFILSKSIELGDTFFVIVRKQPLFFLHWYHHATVLIYSWYSYSTIASNGRWFSAINVAIHCVMYSYYALKALSVRVPRSMSMTITVAQITQMLFGCVVNYHAYQTIRGGESCNVSLTNIYASFAMYASYFVLFAWYFYKSYIHRQIRRQSGDIERVSLKME